MSTYYLNYDIDRMQEARKGSYVVVENFTTSTRIELKWAYVALLNMLVDNAKYDDKHHAYLEEETLTMAKALAQITNKEVSEEKMQKYITELDEADLLDIKENKLYLKRMI